MQVLSANTEAPVHVEHFIDERSLHTTVTRSGFEEACDDLWGGFGDVLRRLLEQVKLPVHHIGALELVGGGTRIPRLQAEIKKGFSNRDVGNRLDKDEAFAMGAAIRAANVSMVQSAKNAPLFSALVLTDVIPWTVHGLILDDPNQRVPLSEIAKARAVFRRFTALPAKIDLTLANVTHNRIFFRLAQTVPNLSHASGLSLLGSETFEISNIHETVQRASTAHSIKPDHFELVITVGVSSSGFLSIEKATALIHPQPTPTPEGKDANKKSPKAKPIPKRGLPAPLTTSHLTLASEGHLAPLDQSRMDAARGLLKQMQVQDGARRRLGMARHELESLVIDLKERLESEDTQSIERIDELTSAANEVANWLTSSDADKAETIDFGSRLVSLRRKMVEILPPPEEEELEQDDPTAGGKNLNTEKEQSKDGESSEAEPQQTQTSEASTQPNQDGGKCSVLETVVGELQRTQELLVEQIQSLDRKVKHLEEQVRQMGAGSGECRNQDHAEEE
eukprot:c19297_g1_i3.p1 GENE.c19297_g1_i3~~c19297_g1_i3.p1  ORF type:complete len:507 (+),score=123.04 c19297_g1_i3:684-2204(+)